MYDHAHITFTALGDKFTTEIEAGITAHDERDYEELNHQHAAWETFEAWIRPIATAWGMPENATIHHFHLAG